MSDDPPAKPPHQSDPGGAADEDRERRLANRVKKALAEHDYAVAREALKLNGEDVDQPPISEPPPETLATLRSLIPVTEASQPALKWATQKLGRKITSALTLQDADWDVLMAAWDEEEHRFRRAPLRQIPKDLQTWVEDRDRIAWEAERRKRDIRARMQAARNVLDEIRTGTPRQLPSRNPAKDLNTFFEGWNRLRRMADQAEENAILKSAGPGNKKFTKAEVIILISEHPDWGPTRWARSSGWHPKTFCDSKWKAIIMRARQTQSSGNPTRGGKSRGEVYEEDHTRGGRVARQRPRPGDPDDR
jgi:hypothetical protein